MASHSHHSPGRPGLRPASRTQTGRRLPHVHWRIPDPRTAYMSAPKVMRFKLGHYPGNRVAVRPVSLTVGRGGSPVLERIIRRIYAEGPIVFRLPGGREVVVGDREAAAVVVRIRDAATARRILTNPALGVGEAFMDGGLSLERGSVFDLLDLTGRELERRPM